MWLRPMRAGVRRRNKAVLPRHEKTNSRRDARDCYCYRKEACYTRDIITMRYSDQQSLVTETRSFLLTLASEKMLSRVIKTNSAPAALSSVTNTRES